MLDILSMSKRIPGHNCITNNEAMRLFSIWSEYLENLQNSIDSQE